jgi:hypothetical protein
MKRFLKQFVPPPIRRLIQARRERLRRLERLERGRTWIPTQRMGEFYPPAPGAARRESNPLEHYFDSHHEGPGIWKFRHYFDIYHRHFAKFQGREINILEIGIYSGGSLGMWKQYFGPKCRVFGVDIAEDCKSYEDEQTTILIGDQSDRKFWARVRSEVPPLDVVIDDGSHVPEHQIVTLEEMLPHVRLGGVFLCEDMETTGNRMMEYVTSLTRNLCEANKTNPDGTISETSTHASWFQSQIHSVHFYPFVTVIEKNYSPVEEFSLEKHGTQWQPWVFYQGQFVDTATRQGPRPAPADQGGVGLTTRNP